MAECTTQTTLSFHPDRPIVVDFDAPEISSDGGALLLRQVDDRIGLTNSFAACISDPRDPAKVIHGVEELFRQRIYGIALGYEDCNDAHRLRHDPILKTTCDRLPDDPVGLSSQPTLSRFENSIDNRTLRRLLRSLENHYIDSLPEDTSEIILDIDSTEDRTYGAQQLSFFSGYHRHHIYHPVLLFDGTTGQLLTLRLRPGNVHESRGSAALLVRLIRRIKKRFPSAHVLVRGDSAFCTPTILSRLDQLDGELGSVDYLFGIARNQKLQRLAAPAMEAATEIFNRDRTKVRHFISFDYAAQSWDRSRLVIAKAEHTPLGPNLRFVVTSLRGFLPESIYNAYCQRGRCENNIKDLKNALQADRLSCSTFTANFFRLILHAAAYCLMHELRYHVSRFSQTLGRAQFDTLRLRILKVAAFVRQSTRRIHIRLPRAFPLAGLFRAIARSLEPPPLPA